MTTTASQTGVTCDPFTTRILIRALSLTHRHELLLFCATTLALLIPIWSVTYLPTTDGAAHIANADILRRYTDLSAFRDYYFIAKEPSPNLIGHLLLAGLLYIAPPVIAEKILVSLYILLFPLALRYAVRSIRLGAAPLSFLAFPLIYSYLLHQGFYNFCLSTAVFFITVGYWIRNRERMTIARTVILFLLALLLYACHLFSLMLAIGTIALLAAWFTFRVPHRFSGGGAIPSRNEFLRSSILTAAAFIPTIILAILYRPGKPVGLEEEPPVHYATLQERLKAFAEQVRSDAIDYFQFRTLISFREKEALIGGAFACLILALFAYVLIRKFARKQWHRWDILLLIPLGLLAIYLKAHDAKSIHFYIPQRVMYYTFLFTILWLAAQPMHARVKWLIPPIAVLIALAQLASNALKYREFAPQLREFVDAGKMIEPNKTFLPLIFAPQGRNAAGQPSSLDVAPFYMASGYIAAQQKAVDLRNYEAKTDHFPVRFRPEKNPYEHLAIGKGLDSIPPVIDIARFESKGARADYIILWGMNDEQRQMDGTKTLLRHLESRYDLIAQSKWTQTWRRRP